MRVAFVGMGRDRSTISVNYLYNFVRYHLELPFYFAQHPEMDVTLTFPGHLHNTPIEEKELDHLDARDDCERLSLVSENHFLKHHLDYDIIVHWRKWFEHLYRPEALNVILSQDHSYGREWLRDVLRAHDEKKLHGILVFPTWHKENMYKELATVQPLRKSVPLLIENLTLGVDTSVYYTDATQDPYQLLWASDPGRGLDQLIPVFLALQAIDKRFQLNVTWPDYVQKQAVEQYRWFLDRPGVNWIGQIPNDEKLHALFRRCGVLPYTSTFKEPSSRCHRQAMACGALVLYPPNMGTPSRLLDEYGDGIVSEPESWARSIYNLVTAGGWKSYGAKARSMAECEDWSVQAERFYKHFKGVKNGD